MSSSYASIGLHIDLTSSQLTAYAGEVLLKEALKYHDKRDFWYAAVNDNIDYQRVESEISHQIKIFKDIFHKAPDHLDGHNHIQISNQQVYDLIQKINASECGNVPLRTPYENRALHACQQNLRDLGNDAKLSQLVHDMRSVQSADIVLYEKAYERLAAPKCAYKFIGTLYGHVRTRKYLFRLIKQLAHTYDTYELMVHPGMNLRTDQKNPFSSSQRFGELLNILIVVWSVRIASLFRKTSVRFVKF